MGQCNVTGIEESEDEKTERINNLSIKLKEDLKKKVIGQNYAIVKQLI